MQENLFEKVVWKMVAIFFQPQCVKSLSGADLFSIYIALPYWVLALITFAFEQGVNFQTEAVEKVLHCSQCTFEVGLIYYNRLFVIHIELNIHCLLVIDTNN